jgi:hypothetical protein
MLTLATLFLIGMRFTRIKAHGIALRLYEQVRDAVNSSLVLWHATATTRVARVQAGTSGTRFAGFMGIFGGDLARLRNNPGLWFRIGPTNDTVTGG